MSKLSEEEKEAFEYFTYFNLARDIDDNDIKKLEILLNLIKKQQLEIERLKYLVKKATEIIDEYANETEKDIKKLIEYQEKFLQI